MLAPCGKSCTLAYSRQSLEQLASLVASPLQCCNGFDKVFYPECNTPSATDDGLYPYQRVARDLLRGADELNLLVSSPTGSGKSRVIEECVAIARARGQRIFVAEPLIALVEQIYTRIGGENICMLTGPSRKGAENADVVVCTYEVLARIASCEPQRLDGCPRIVLDEFHFLATDRGPVIEEILAHCQVGRSIVALSGTMPNVSDLAAFLTRINGFPTHVLGAARRPIEISFYAYAAAEDSMSTLVAPDRPQPFRAQAVGGIGDRQSLLRFMAQLEKWDCHPSLLVAFSCRRLDEMADWATAATSIERDAKRLVAVGFAKLLKGVEPEDRGLFAIYRHWADHGVAVHHSHAPTPYLELVSWLAERRALKLVFSSSTLSAGINLPVRTMCLLSARVPKKSPEGGMDHVDIDPLLFHQLVGRAGRPGYETEGNCLILIKKRTDYASAQTLMTSRVPAVLPLSGFSAGDVLRATRDGRNMLAEIQALACPMEHALSLRAMRDSQIKEAALAQLKEPALAELLEQQVSAVHDVLRAPASLLPFAAVTALEGAHLIVYDDGGFSIRHGVINESQFERIISLTTPRRGAKRIPFEDVCAVLALQEAFKTLMKPVQDDGGLREIRRICFLHEQAKIYLASSPLQEEFDRSARAMEGACLTRTSDGYVLTPLGHAACELRTCADPSVVLQRLLSCGSLDSTQALAFASQVLREGGSLREEPVVDDKQLEAQLQEARGVLDGEGVACALKGFEGSSREWTLAVLCWAKGASLTRLQQLLPVGCFCRHITRVADFCAEASQALKSLGVDPFFFEEAADMITRGMPFAKRGVWKSSPDEETDFCEGVARVGGEGNPLDDVFGDNEG